MDQESLKGQVNISDDVVTSIVSHVVMDTPGISGMSGSSISGGWVKRLAGKAGAKGLSVEVSAEQVAIHLGIIVNYGCAIQEVCRNLQLNVRNAVENMMGLSLVAVHVKVERIAFS
ncbi:Asp23/Gls24 family envelope stress response protein [Paenibacillus donghaensis]|uniref:Alkaline shock protein 23 n=1 Tax=Paenibacillus donghaensis TaxID=414771 RepID=A0A2Z2K7E7_9BACL|nr:Asp23/Gls24 family envelope stress response protein [Paenibacillus donghaensis]ASA22356.1 Asp23/Gls24 family envelope stress response protein [Paenibacillus donghaensis]